uniref:Ribosomal protein L29 n=1 Tax=Polysiphonia urceolata TaxID=173545 RepID=A0A1Z1MBT7_POLUR|nr:ribosomal protein L29 [Polysiphonia stricta]ARW63567.1 ribosomal protein L29 [Polysiphonia stricta]
MDIEQEVTKLKKELVILRVNKITKQKTERHKVKKIQHRISQILQIDQDKNE